MGVTRYFTGNRRLSEERKNRIDQLRQQGGRMLVPTIVLAEALAAKGRVAFDFDRPTGSLQRRRAFMAHTC